MNLNKKTVQSSQRNYGIDLLRLVAAFYVIILHTLNQGGVFKATALYSHQDLVCRLLLIFSYCAVNIFGIISGYVGYREPGKEISFSGYLPLWLTVVFYNVIFTGIYMYILPGTVTGGDLAYAFFPLTKNLHWYFTAYTMVYFLSPFLNRAVHHSSEKEAKLLFLLICFAFTPIEYIGRIFETTNGYSAIWLLILYLIGATMKKTGIGSRIPSFAAVLAIILINTVFLYLSIYAPNISVFLFNFSFELDYSYVTPFYLASAILHVILFSRLRFSSFWKKIITFAAPAAFSVYIANTQPYFWLFFMKDRFVHWATGSPAGIFVRTIAFVFIFIFAVILVDFFRQTLFKLLGVRKWPQKLSQAFHKKTTV